MTSRNFEFLRERYAALATLGAFAENYVRSDPDSACVKLRVMMEQIVRSIYDEQHLEKPEEDTFFNLLDESAFRSIVPESVQLKLHAIRQAGNKAAHGRDVTTATATQYLREGHGIAIWFYLTYTGGSVQDFAHFEEPGPGLAAASAALMAQVAQQEEQLSTVLEALEAERTKRLQLERRAEAELQAVRRAAENSASALNFSEAQTRKFLIDTMLVDAGWDVGAKGQDTADVGQGVALKGVKTLSGRGEADYVLWGSDGKPLGVPK